MDREQEVCDFLRSNYPDIDGINNKFWSCKINTEFTDLEIDVHSSFIVARPYKDFYISSINENVRIFSIPEKVTIAYCAEKKIILTKKPNLRWYNQPIIRFWKNKNMNYGFRENLLEHTTCTKYLYEFIKKHPNHKLIKTNISDRLNKLLIFM
jgi:hypothetical protein